MGEFPKPSSPFQRGTGDPLNPGIEANSVSFFRRGPVSGQQSNNCSLEEERDTFLWRIDTKVSKHLKRNRREFSFFQPPSYFFGTIHVPYTRVWDAVSTNTKKAFHAADKVGIGFCIDELIGRINCRLRLNTSAAATTTSDWVTFS